MTKRIQIFKAGRHTATNGKAYDFTEAHLDAIASTYDPAKHDAPVVIGHPKMDDPAWGWTVKVEREGDALFAEIDRVDPAFAEAVEAGRYAKISPSFYGPGQQGNPTPDGFYLRHIGFLGAQPPAVKGMAPVQFGDGEEFIEFADVDTVARQTSWLARTVARLARAIREDKIERDGVEAADKLISNWDADAPTEIAAELMADVRQPGISYAEGESSAEAQAMATRLADLEAREAAVKAREDAAEARSAEFAESARQERQADDAAFVDQLVSAGKLPPARRPEVLGFFEALAAAEPISFAEGAEAESPHKRFRELLSALGTSIHFSELAPATGVDFAEPANRTARLAARAQVLVREATARGETLSTASAVQMAANEEA